MTDYYERRSEWPKPDLEHPEWQARIKSVKQWIEGLPDNKQEEQQRLRIGALWGPRGTGKTSFLHVLYRELEKSRNAKLYLPRFDPQTKKQNQKPSLFTPDLIDDTNGDHLFTHFLAYLAEHYQVEDCPDFNLKEALDGPQATLTEHRYHNEFRNFHQETAVSERSLKEQLQQRLTDQAKFSSILRRELKKTFQKCTGQFVVLVDDLDLVPHRGPEFLRLLHLYLRDLPFVVLITGDRQQLIDHTIIDNKNRYQKEDRELALQLVAKLVPYELDVPYLAPETRIDGLLGGPGDRLGEELKEEFRGAAIPLMDGWREWNRKVALRDDNDDDNDNRADENEEPIWVKEPSRLLGRLLSPRWRAIHRTYNRLATIRDLERHSKQHQTGNLERHSEKNRTAEYSFTSRLRSLGIPPELESLTHTALLAIDEHYPALDLWESFVQDRENLLGELALLQELSTKSVRASDMGAPLDRLFSRMEGRERHAAKRALTEVQRFFDVVRHIKTAKQLVNVFALSAASSERSAADEIKDFLRTTKVIGRDLRNYLDGQRPSADVIKTMVGQLQQEALPHTDTVFLRAPLSLAAWLGWYTRMRPQPPKTALGLFEQTQSRFTLDSDQLKRSLMEPSVLEVPIQARFEHSDTARPLPDEAMVVVDIRQQPDASSRALPLLQGSEQVEPQHAYKLTSRIGFILTEDNFHDILSDILWMFGELRDEGIKRFHIALATPAPLAFFIGQQLHAFAPVELYEYAPEDPAYHHVATLA